MNLVRGEVTWPRESRRESEKSSNFEDKIGFSNRLNDREESRKIPVFLARVNGKVELPLTFTSKWKGPWERSRNSVLGPLNVRSKWGSQVAK